MKDKNGKQIKKGMFLYSEKYELSGPKMQVVGFNEENGNCILRQQRTGECAIELTQEQLSTTHQWIVLDAHK